MKKFVLSIWQLKPVKWLRRMRSFKLIYTPLIAIVLFTVVMGVIMGTLQLQEKGQQEAALFRELSFAKQRIQLRFANNTDVLQSIGRDYIISSESAKAKENVVIQAENLLQSNHEIAQIIWINETAQRQWKIPLDNLKTDWFNKPENASVLSQALKKTIELSAATNRPAFSQFISLEVPSDELISKEIRNVFWQAVPQIYGGEIKGMLSLIHISEPTRPY